MSTSVGKILQCREADVNRPGPSRRVPRSGAGAISRPTIALIVNFEYASLGRLEPGTAILWLVGTLVACVVCCLRQDEVSRLHFRPSFASIALVGPLAALAISIAVFRFGMSHPLVQYNDDASRWWWSLWV